MIFEWQRNNLSRSLNLLQLFQSCLYDTSLHLNVVWFTSVCTHRYHRSYGTRCTSLSYNRRQCCDDYSRDADGLNCSLHDCCRAVASSSSSSHHNCINVLILKSLCNFRTCVVGESFDVSTTTHESIVVRSSSLDESFCSQLMQSGDRIHAVDVLIYVRVIVTTVSYHQLFFRCVIWNFSESEVTSQIESFLVCSMYTCSCSQAITISLSGFVTGAHRLRCNRVQRFQIVNLLQLSYSFIIIPPRYFLLAPNHIDVFYAHLCC